jgi:hypothetical protein
LRQARDRADLGGCEDGQAPQDPPHAGRARRRLRGRRVTGRCPEASGLVPQPEEEPEVELQDGATKRDYVAREVTGDEKRLWWERAVETWPDYATYQTKTDRQIPVFVLEEVDQ